MFQVYKQFFIHITYFFYTKDNYLLSILDINILWTLKVKLMELI